MKKIKRFFIYNIILSFVLVGTLYFLSWMWNNYNSNFSTKFLEFERKNIKNLKIVNIGSSHTAYGIKYPKNIKAYNLGMVSQKFYYDYEILKKFYNRFDKNCIIIIPVSIMSFYNGYDVKDITQNYITFLDEKVLIGIDKKQYLLGKYFSIIQPIIRIPKILKYIFISLKNKNFDKKLIFYPSNISLKETKREATKRALSHLGITDKRYSHNKNIGINQLKEIIYFCEEKKFKPVLISTPQTYLYNNEIGDKNYQERIYNNIKEVEKQLGKKYLYLDYSHDKRFEDHLGYFADSDHLNEKGAEYFTEILLDDIKSYGYNFE